MDKKNRENLSEEQLKDIDAELEKDVDYLNDIKQFKEESLLIDEQKQRKIMKRGKWRARTGTAIRVIYLLVLITIVTSILTHFYYSSGSPIKLRQGEKIQNIIDYTFTITDPYGFAGTTHLEEGRYFTLNTTRDQYKVIGNTYEKVGELETGFFLSFMGTPKEREFSKRDQVLGFLPSSHESESAWEQLNILPEGTVTTAYITLADKMETHDIIDLLADQDLRLLWLALETGREQDGTFIDEPIGFPPYLFIQEGFESKELTSEMLQEQFVTAIKFLQKHENKVNKFMNQSVDFENILQHIDNRGFSHYGIVVTGPTKELLSLRDEEWIGSFLIDDVGFWNWD